MRTPHHGAGVPTLRTRMRTPHHGGSVIHQPTCGLLGRGGGTCCRALGEMASAAGGLYYAL
jgi:hypothetical protein